MQIKQIVIRFFDVVFSLFGLIVLAPLGLGLWVTGYFYHGNPIFRQIRVGKNKHPFTLLKFRSLDSGLNAVATHLQDFSGISAYGKFLRLTKLDEIPQLWNVLVGEMSLVGPRPCLYNQLELIAARDRLNVFSVKPGITGLGQIRGVNMASPELLARVDRELINRYGISQYFLILFSTLLSLLQKFITIFIFVRR